MHACNVASTHGDKSCSLRSMLTGRFTALAALPAACATFAVRCSRLMPLLLLSSLSVGGTTDVLFESLSRETAVPACAAPALVLRCDVCR